MIYACLFTYILLYLKLASGVRFGIWNSYALLSYFFSLLASTPTFEKIVVDIELIKHLTYQMVYQIIHCLWPVIESGHGWQNYCVSTCKSGHIF